MTLRVFQKGPGPIGCVIGRRGIGLAQIANRRGQHLSLECVWTPGGAGPQAGDSDSAGWLRSAFGSARFLGRKIVSCVASERADFRLAHIPTGPEGDAATAVREWAVKELGIDTQSFCVDYFPIPQAEGANRDSSPCIAVAVPQGDIDRHVALFKGAGLSLLALDFSGAAIARCLGPGVDQGDTTLVVELGDSARTYTIARSGMPVIACSKRSPRGDALVASASASVSGGSRSGSAPSSAHPGPAHRAATVALDVAADVRSFLQFLEDERLDHILPTQGVVVGADETEPETVNTLSADSSIGFLRLREAVVPMVRDALDTANPGSPQTDLIVAAGLALYIHEPLADGVRA